MASPPHRERADARPRPAVAGARPTAGAGHPVLEPARDARPLRERAREVLEVPGPASVATVVRGLGVLTALSVVAALPWGVVGLSLMALVLLGVTLARVVRLYGGLQLLLDVTLLVAAWAALLQLYQRWWWLDVVVHVVATGLLTVLAVVLLARTGLLPTPASRRTERLRLGAVALAAGLALAVVWELGEWAGHTYLDPEIYVSAVDTVGDLAAGVLGAAVAAWWLATRRVVP
ncbi:hypothetical protein KZX45_19435 [Georgenia sp. EYE_87]|uniref:hypothetical protein n=1 Tax=Georgenia sp. EYE_87 TaxID=2853448 RepID=UPI0020059670|nr:hypothetical protein [Georgenia sp. EYE_87]MCK6212716.1 hypothetical protein [Georgenia sp. EYE_87]